MCDAISLSEEAAKSSSSRIANEGANLLAPPWVEASERADNLVLAGILKADGEPPPNIALCFTAGVMSHVLHKELEHRSLKPSAHEHTQVPSEISSHFIILHASNAIERCVESRLQT